MTSYYYCIDAVLKQAEKNEAAGNKIGTLIPVNREPCACSGQIDDCFVLANPVHMMHLDDGAAVNELAQLLQEVPLYHLNMKLVLDEALAERQHNAAVHEALKDAFAGGALPDTQTADGGLRHPALEQMDTMTLSRIYTQFLMHLRRHKADFSFQRNILGRNLDPFLQQFDGFFEDGHGQIKSNILLAFGLRLDHDPHKPLESYTYNGQMAARKRNITEPHELVWAWLECDDYQQRRCRDLHRVMKLTSLPRMPNWVRLDVFRFLEMEAMKQSFAEKIVNYDPELSVLNGTLQLKRAIRMNAAGQIDEQLQQLLSQTINADSPYIDAAMRFADAADIRKKEGHKIRLG